jgi:hypothetical protein
MAADIPIRQIVLYKSGVGYFERAGQLGPGESARLDFKANEMNDVLKSLTLLDKSGAKIAGLRYDSSEPLEQKLAEFPFNVDGGQSLSAFLAQVRGARIEMKYGAENIAGNVVSGRTVAASDKSPEREQVVILLDSGEMRTLDLSAATSIKFSEPKLQTQLRDYLTAVNQARSKDKRSVYIDSSDAQGRDIVASYMVPMPVWKSSYRLIFSADAQPTLEGWAIVDNTSGEDWTKVKMSVVSGRPVSFISRLYDAKFLTRPTVDLPEDRAQGPVVYEGAMDAVAGSVAPPSPPAMAPAPMMSVRVGSAKFRKADGAPEQVPEFAFMPSSVAATAEGRDLGDLFEYSFASPVTVKKNESVMLPFLQQKLNTRKLLIYSESYGKNPMSAAELTNSTGKTLDGGPITVFDSGNYSGEALVETLRPNDKRLISYAVDLGTRITTQFDTTSNVVREIHASHGLITTTTAMQELKTYTIKNVDAKAKTLVIEHPQRSGYTLLNMKASETTPNAYRFEIKLGPNATEKFPVAEEHMYSDTVSVSSMNPDSVYAYIQNKLISAAARQQLQQISDLKRQAADTDRSIRQNDADIAELIKDQDRIRQNIGSLNNVSGQQEQVQKYSRRLAEQETNLAALRDNASELRKKKNALDVAVVNAVDRLNF